jgi:hypothetical protein
MDNKSIGYRYAVQLESSVGLLCGMERNSSVGIAAARRLDLGNMLLLMAEARDISSAKHPGRFRGPPSRQQGLFPRRYCSRCLNLIKQVIQLGARGGGVG